MLVTSLNLLAKEHSRACLKKEDERKHVMCCSVSFEEIVISS